MTDPETGCVKDARISEKDSDTGHLEELGFETETIVHEVAGRAKQIFFYTRHGRDARSAQELEQELRDLTESERAELVAVSVAWWDGVLTGLRARKLSARTHGRTGARP